MPFDNTATWNEVRIEANQRMNNRILFGFGAIGLLVLGTGIGGALLHSSQYRMPAALAPEPKTIAKADARAPTPAVVGRPEALDPDVTTAPLAGSSGTSPWTVGTATFSNNTVSMQGMVTTAPPPVRGANAPEPLIKPPAAVESADALPYSDADLARYRAAAKDIGVEPTELTINEFRSFLSTHQIPSYEVSKVVGYMDGIAARDNASGYGWHWAPVRAGDARDIHLGNGSVSYGGNCFFVSGSNFAGASNVSCGGGNSRPASDFYDGLKTIYSRTIPLHALQLIGQIEHQFGAGRVAFMVSDFTTTPDRVVKPDPFLMVVIPNDGLSTGEGRFIIDSWDEPGFGLK